MAAEVSESVANIAIRVIGLVILLRGFIRCTLVIGSCPDLIIKLAEKVGLL